jgi:GH24 family phage-related lysozyme (muramidase)
MSCNRISKEDWAEIQKDERLWVVLDCKGGLIGIFSSRRKAEALLIKEDTLNLNLIEIREWPIE